MTRYTSDAAAEVAKRFAAKSTESPRVAAARRLIANASPGNREAVAASVINDARDLDEIKVLHAVVDEELAKAEEQPAPAAAPADPRAAERDRIIAEGGDPVFHVGGVKGGGWLDSGRRRAGEPDDVG